MSGNIFDIVYRRAVSAFTQNSAETTENAEFYELKTRHYKAPMNDIYEAIQKKVDIWIGWDLDTKKKDLGNIAVIKCKVRTPLSLIKEADVSIWLTEEMDAQNQPETIVNVKSTLNLDNGQPDLGENQRIIAMLILALDELFPTSENPIHPSISKAFISKEEPKKQKVETTTIKAPGQEEAAAKTEKPSNGKSKEIKVTFASKNKK
ncbi:conserved hypothetical protein [Chloroherpeton thalassium ATCC 35110]|uniref:Uncharacterized protein n=1 Tax=Chloroherpeton thalassium (strain ATCC 35110 / GB-78) TaxID=517418 RepID=B3QS42_CHLT3|nr:hypothetical protein [Chloroherpeton thalassium]ACF13987.1 conserved hypothetical protein [Chloroherpeton thalassium ATCC 35110]